MVRNPFQSVISVFYTICSPQLIATYQKSRIVFCHLCKFLAILAIRRYMEKRFSKLIKCLITNLPVFSKHRIIFLGTLNLHLTQTHLPVSNQQFLDDVENFILLHIVDWSLTGDGLKRKSHLLHNHLSGICL